MTDDIADDSTHAEADTSTEDAGTTRIVLPIPGAGEAIELNVPHAWHVVDGAGEGPLLLTGFSEPGPAMRSLVVTVETLGSRPLRGWQENWDLAMVDNLDGYLLIDLEPLSIAGDPGIRRLAHYVFGNALSLTIEQLALARAGHGITLTCTVLTHEYPVIAGEFSEILESVEIR